MSPIAEVSLWGRRIGVALQEENAPAVVFEYDRPFLSSGIEAAPLQMPLSPRPYSFPALPQGTFKGLPGMLADSLPDRFGSEVLAAWLARQGRDIESISAIDRLCYMGERGMGALEFSPAWGPNRNAEESIEVSRLVELASAVLAERDGFHTKFEDGDEEQALLDIISVGSSAGGARAKAVIAIDRRTGEVRSGQIEASPGFEHWLLKFDGVRDWERLEDSEGYGAIEFAYSRMADEAGIEMSECDLMEENGRRHFMTRRFDRIREGGKLHMQSLGAIAHFDFERAGAYSYEQAFLTMRQLKLPMAAIEQLFRRMTFNVIARNQDDHVKNIAFLMDPEGHWSLSPAFDVTYSYRPSGGPTARHQMTINGKQDDFVFADLERCAEAALLKRGRAATIVAEVNAAVERWPEQAAKVDVPAHDVERIGRVHRLDLKPSRARIS
jgi:serine/threonine-protein kinase HipA